MCAARALAGVLCSLVLIAPSASVCAAAAEDVAAKAAEDVAARAPENVYRLVNERLAWMQAVAAYKWAHGVAIDDPEREASVIERGVADGLRAGMVPASARVLFRAQIDGAGRHLKVSEVEAALQVVMVPKLEHR